jgi:DNA-binding protein HU-beta
MPKAAPKKSAAAGKSKTGATVTITLKQMAAELAERHDLSKKQSEAVLADLVTLTTRHLKKGERLGDQLAGYVDQPEWPAGRLV